MAEKIIATLTYTAGHPPGIRAFQIHFPCDEPTDVELPQHKIDWLRDRGCEIATSRQQIVDDPEPVGKSKPRATKPKRTKRVTFGS